MRPLFSTLLRAPWQRQALAAVLALLLTGASVGVATFWPATRPAAPDLRFTDLNGRQISLQALRGKVVLVNFWATSCSVCGRELPQMIATYNQYKGRGLEFVAVAMSYDRPDYVLDYAQTHKLPFIVTLDWQDTLARAFGDIKATPTTFLIGKDGAIVKRYVGEPEFDALHRLLEKELGA